MTETPDPVERRLPPRLVLRLTLISAAIAMAVAWFIVIRPLDDDPAGPTDRGDTTTAGVGRAAPDVTFEGLDGPSVDLSELHGRIVVLNFWASTCAPCIKEMPLLQAVADDRPEVAFVGISVAESAVAGRSMVERTGVEFPQGRDPGGDALAQFGGIALPHTVVIGADGTVAALANRALRDRADLDELIGRAA